MNAMAQQQQGGFQAATSYPSAEGSEQQQQQERQQYAPSTTTATSAVNIATASHQSYQQGYQHGASRSRQQQFACLYTKQKTQKRKKWHDGRLVIKSSRASLYDAHPPPGSGDPTLDTCELTGAQCQALMQGRDTRLETEKFLVQVEGPWTGSSQSPTTTAPPSAAVSRGMQKVIGRKFRKPGAFVPRNPMQQQQATLGKRQRAPLQPGELQRRYYGDVQQSPPPLNQGPAMQAQPRWGQGQQQPPPPMNKGPTMQEAQPTWGQGQPHAPQPQVQTPPAWNQGATQAPPQLANQSMNGHYQQAQGQQGLAGPPAVHGQSTDTNQQQPPPAPMRQPHAVGPGPQQLETASSGAPSTSQKLVRNAFKPGSIYGEEESSGDEEDAPSGGFGWNTTPQAAAKDPPTPQEKVDSLPSSQPASSDDNDGSALSTNDLLKLFGGAPQPAAAPSPANVSTESQQEKEDTTKRQGEGQFEFVLPPASDSSSDEDE